MEAEGEITLQKEEVSVVRFFDRAGVEGLAEAGSIVPPSLAVGRRVFARRDGLLHQTGYEIPGASPSWRFWLYT